jgi:hypothetical protein
MADRQAQARSKLIRCFKGQHHCPIKRVTIADLISPHKRLSTLLEPVPFRWKHLNGTGSSYIWGDFLSVT